MPNSKIYPIVIKHNNTPIKHYGLTDNLLKINVNNVFYITNKPQIQHGNIPFFNIQNELCYLSHNIILYSNPELINFDNKIIQKIGITRENIYHIYLKVILNKFINDNTLYLVEDGKLIFKPNKKYTDFIQENTKIFPKETIKIYEKIQDIVNKLTIKEKNNFIHRI